MTIQDHIQYNTLERVISDDANNAQNLSGRERAEMFRALAREFEVAVPANAPVRSHVCSGLNVSVSGGTSFVVGPGLLGQQIAASPPQVPTPGALDSSYRFGINYTNASVADPWDASDAYWLLQARVEQVVALQETRDIYNPTTQVFAPSGAPIDKRLESQIVYTWKKGTATALPSPDAGQCPLAGVFRPIGGGAIAIDDVFQLAIRVSDLSNFKSEQGANKRSKFRWGSVEGITANSPDVQFDLAGEIDGVKLFARTTADVVINDVEFLDPSDVAVHNVADYWWYVYLAKVGDQLPCNLYSNIEHRGVIVASRVPPDDKGRNQALIDVPDPIGGTVAAGDAVHVAMYRSTGTTNIESVQCNDRGEASIQSILCFTMTTGDGWQDTNTFDFATLGPGGTELLPYGAMWKMNISTDIAQSGGVSAVAFRFNWADTMGGQRFMNSQKCSCNELSNEFWLESSINVMSRDVSATALNASQVPIANVNLGTTEYRLNCVGFHF